MADIQTPHHGITGTYKGFDAANSVHNYEFVNPVGTKVEYKSPYDLSKMQNLMKPKNFSTDSAANDFSDQVLTPLMSGDQRDFLQRVVYPNLRAIPANIAGLVPEVASLLTFIPGPDDLVMAPFKEGDDWKWWETKGAKELRKTMKPIGVEQQKKRFEQWSRMAEKYLRAQGVPDEVNPLSVLGTDMTPEEHGWAEKAVSMAMEFGLSGAGEVKAFTEGAGAIQWLTRQARNLVKAKGEKALDKENIKSLIDKARNYYSVRSKAGWQHLGAEVGFGGAAGASSAGALAALESADPEAADWLKALTAIGAGIVGPVTAKTGITGFFLLPGVKLARKVTDPIFFPATSAARFQQQAGGQSTKQVAHVHDILALAVREERHLDKAAGLMFTTPELARAEAARVRVMLSDQKGRLESPTGQQMDAAAKEKVAADIERLEGEYLDLNQYANFQEAVYRAAFQSETAPKFWARESKRLIERRNSFFNAIDNTFRKGMDNINFGGKSGGTDVELKADYDSARNKGTIPQFEVNRRRLIEESDPQGIAANEMKFLTPDLQKQVGDVNTTVRDDLQKVLDEAHVAVEDRVANFTEALDGYAASKGLKSFDDLPDHERQFAGRVIRDMYKDADREFRAFEKAAFSRVKGLKDPVTENIRFPEGSKDPLGNDITGLTVEEFASNYIENLSLQEKFATKNVPVELAHLVGRRTLLQALKRTDPESGVRQTLISHIEAEIKQQQDLFSSLGKTEAGVVTTAAKAAESDARKSRSAIFAKLPPPGLTLLEYMAREGGIVNVGGEMASRIDAIGNWNKTIGRRQAKLDLEDAAINPDRARETAAELGYIGPDSPGGFANDMEGFWKAVDAELEGRPVHTPDDAVLAKAIDDQGEVVEDLLKTLGEVNEKIKAEGGVEIPEFHPSGRRRSNADLYKDVEAYHTKDLETSPGVSLEETFDAVTDVELSPKRAEIARKLQELQAERIKLEKDEFGEVLSFADDVEGLTFNLGESGRLTSRTAAGDLISEGVSAGDVSAVISDVQENIRREGAKAVPNERRITNLRKLRNTLEQLLTPENFPNLDPQQLRFARDASMVRHRAQEAMGKVLGKDPSGAALLHEEVIAGTVLPSVAKSKLASQAADVRMIETAAAKFSDDLVTFERTTLPDGRVEVKARINEDILQPNTRLFAMDESPFEMRKIGTDQVDFEVRIKEGYLPSPQAIETVENALLEQLSIRFPKGAKPEDIAGVEKFRQEYDHALKWLKRHSPDQKESAATFVDDLDSLNVQLEAINGLRTDKMRQRLVALQKQGALAEGFDVEDYVQYIGDRQVKIAGDKALQDILRSDPGYATKRLVDRVLDSSRPGQEIDEFLSVLKNNRQAMEGFQNAFIGDLFKRSSFESAELKKVEGITASMFEPEKFRTLIANPKMRTALQKVFPDNPDLLPGLEKLAQGAAEVGPYGLGTARGGAAVRPEDFFQKEVWSNLGRILGIFTAKKTGLANELWAAGTGGRIFRQIGQRTTGNTVKDMVIEAALNPEVAVAFSKDIVEFGTLGGLAKKYIVQNLNIPMEVLERARKTPGALMEILTYPTQEMEEEEEVSAVAPARSRSQQVASYNVKPPIASGSLLDKVQPFLRGGGGMGAGTTAPGTAGPRGQEIFGAMDPVFKGAPRANQGGLVSLCGPNKPRQMVS